MGMSGLSPVAPRLSANWVLGGLESHNWLVVNGSNAAASLSLSACLAVTPLPCRNFQDVIFHLPVLGSVLWLKWAASSIAAAHGTCSFIQARRWDW